MERPNTISGLQSKRKELVKLHGRLVDEAKKVLCDIDHLDATIRLFDPDADIERIRLNRYATKHRAPKGHLKRFVLDTFREANEALTSKEITSLWIEDRGLKPDESTRVILTKRIGACLTKMKNDGVIRHVDYKDGLKLWVMDNCLPKLGKVRSTPLIQL